MIQKNILFVLIFLSISNLLYSQEFYSMGNGIYVCEYQKGTAGWPASGKAYSATRKFIADYASEKQVDFEIISESDTYTRTTRPIVKIKFRLIYESKKIATESSSIIGSADYDQNGNQTNVTITSSNSGKSNSEVKEGVIKELRQLKSLLDEGILTKEEYDAKAEKLKKILLDN
jgi:hypothetical protein